MNGKIIEFLIEQWATLDDGQVRIAFPPGEPVFSGLRRSGDYLHVDPGGFRAPFIMNVPATIQYRTTKMK
jgi:hypothetical protein